MGNLFQTSGFRIQEHEANELLRVFPLQISIEETPTLFFRLDGELQIGAELKQGPFTAFSATHEQISSGKLLEYTDEIHFNGESPELASILERTKIQYSFPSRQKLLQGKNAFESRRKTESFQAFSSENLSAG